MASVEEIQRKQAKMVEKAEALAEKTDANEIIEAAKKLTEDAKELERMAKGLEKAFAPPPGAVGNTRVLLTAEQRQRIAEATGLGMEVVIMPGNSAELNASMRTMDPAKVEAEALKQVAERVLVLERRKALTKIIKQLEKEIPEPVPEAQVEIDKLKEELRSLGGPA
jgi:transposase